MVCTELTYIWDSLNRASMLMLRSNMFMMDADGIPEQKHTVTIINNTTLCRGSEFTGTLARLLL